MPRWCGIRLDEAENAMNEFELMLVHEDMLKRGITDYTVQPGNNCLWVSYQRVNAYYIFQDGVVVDIQYD